MKYRLFAVSAAFCFLLTLVASPASAHDSDGSGSFDQKGEAFEEILARGDASESVPERGRCIDGMAAGMFECNNIDLMAHVSLQELGLSFVNDIWGWTDRITGREYAIVGGIEGTVFVDITGSLRPPLRRSDDVD